MNKEKNDLWSSLLILAIGIFTVANSLNYSIGTLQSMQPGYLPFFLGCILIALSLIILIKDLTNIFLGGENNNISVKDIYINLRNRFKVISIVSIAILSFAYLSTNYGLIAATFTLAFLSSLVDRKNTLLSTLITSISITLFTVIVFHYFLGIQIPLWTS